MGRVQDKVCVITGGARGLGLAAAELLLAEGAKVLLTDVDTAEGEKQAARLGARAMFMQQDATDPDRWNAVLDAAIEKWGKLDVLVNNAGIAIIQDVEASSLEAWKKTLDINLTAVFLGTQAAIARMKAAQGSIVNIASIEGLIGEPLVPPRAAFAFSASRRPSIAHEPATRSGSTMSAPALRRRRWCPVPSAPSALKKARPLEREFWDAFPWGASHSRPRSQPRFCSSHRMSRVT